MDSKTIQSKILHFISTSHRITQFHCSLYGSKAGIPWSAARTLTTCTSCSSEKWIEKLRANRAHQQNVNSHQDVLKWSSNSLHLAFMYSYNLLWRLLSPIWVAVPRVAAAVAEVCLAVQQLLIFCGSQAPNQRPWSHVVTQALPAPRGGPA